MSLFARIRAAIRRWKISDQHLLDLLLASSSGQPLDQDVTEPADLLKAGWNAGWRDRQHELAHDYYVRSLAVARLRSDRAAVAAAVLAISARLVWHCPKNIEDSGIDLDDVYMFAWRLFRSLDDEVGIAGSLRGLGRYEESLAISRRIEDRRGVALCLRQLALRAWHKSPEQATAYAEEATAIARENGDDYLLAVVLGSSGIGSGAIETDRRAAFLEARELYRKLGHRWDEAETTTICAMLACDADARLQDQLLTEACRMWRELGNADLEASCRKMMADFAAERELAANNDRRGTGVRSQNAG